jgi:hypothetical protein
MARPGLTARERLDKDFLEHVILHTYTLGDAAAAADITAGTMIVHRRKYDISKPANRYTGPRLTHEEMYESFAASMAPPAARSLYGGASLDPSLTVTFVPPACPSSFQPLAPG